jgi:putative DNA primase/helicase
MNEAARIREDAGLVQAYVELILGGMDEAEIGALWDELVSAKGEEFAARVEAEVVRRDVLLREQISNEPIAPAPASVAEALEERIARAEAPEFSAIEREWRERKEGAAPQAEEQHSAAEPAGPRTVSRARPRDAAKLVVSQCAVDGVSRLRFQGGTFWFWNGGTYERESDDAVRKTVADFLYDARTGDGAAFNPKKRDIDEVLDALKMEALLEDRFAAPCWLPGGEWAAEWIVCRNGIVNVRTGEMRAHTHRLWSHGALGFDWEPAAKCRVFDAYLESIFPGDPEAQQCAVEWLGLCMTLDTFPHKGMLLLGERRAGKSTFLRLMEQLVGREGYVAYTFESLIKSELSPHGMIGKRVIAFPDVRLKQGQQYGKNYDAGGLSHEARGMLLRITGVDTVSFRLGYSAARWEGALPGKVIIVSNEVPNFNDDVLPTRFLKLHFKVDQEKTGNLDPSLGDKLRAELPGIAARALTGYRELVARKHRFVQPTSGLELERQLQRARHPHRAMVLECLEVSDGEDDWAVKKDAFQACRRWLRENGHDIPASLLRQEEMGERLADVFDHLRVLSPRDRYKQRTDGHRYWVRLRLSAEGRRLIDGD